MLQEIYIKNLVLIDELRMEFGPGFNVLTGETGAGKSIIMDALGLISGERVRSELVRDPEKRALVEATFFLDDNPEALSSLRSSGILDEDDDLAVISREIIPGGRSLVRLNGHNISLGELKNLAPLLLDMHLQHEHLSILKPSLYLRHVDGFIGEDGRLLHELAGVYAVLSRQREKLDNIIKDEAQILQQIDFLTYQIQEIEKAGLYPGEEEELSGLAHRIRNAQRLSEGTARIMELLEGNDQVRGVVDLLAAAVDTSAALKDEPFFAHINVEIEEIYYSLQDISARLSAYSRELDFEPGRLDEVEDRLYEIKRLKNKYGQSIEAILEYAKQSRQELDNLNHSQELQEQLAEEIAMLEHEYLDLARRVSGLRREAASILKEKVRSELAQLNLPNLYFDVVVSPGDKWTAQGMDKVEFMFSANPGEEPRPLEKVASGGEISRFVLALKTALADVYKVPTLVFDEIDVGVGGNALNAMAHKLAQLAQKHQVILVTHAPQVACLAGVHYAVEKEVSGGSTITRTRLLDPRERVEEIARMLGGENYSEITLAHAEEMLKANRV